MATSERCNVADTPNEAALESDVSDFNSVLSGATESKVEDFVPEVEKRVASHDIATEERDIVDREERESGIVGTDESGSGAAAEKAESGVTEKADDEGENEPESKAECESEGEHPGVRLEADLASEGVIGPEMADIELPENVTPVSDNELEEKDSDDDFGSFDEASIEDLKAEENDSALFDRSVLHNPALFDSRLDEIIQILLPSLSSSLPATKAKLLSQNASERYKTLSEAPRLHPPSWAKLKMRHNLLQNLGLPVDLEEVEGSPMHSYRFANPGRKKSVTELDIDWQAIELPSLDLVTIGSEQRAEFLREPNSLLSALEDDPVKDYSKLSLENCSPEMLDQKLKSMTAYHSRLLQLCAVGKENIEELRRSQEVFESVVENLVGYNQKVQRNELLEKLSRSKNKKGKKTF